MRQPDTGLRRLAASLALLALVAASAASSLHVHLFSVPDAAVAASSADPEAHQDTRALHSCVFCRQVRGSDHALASIGELPTREAPPRTLAVLPDTPGLRPWELVQRLGARAPPTRA